MFFCVGVEAEASYAEMISLEVEDFVLECTLILYKSKVTQLWKARYYLVTYKFFK